LVIRIWNTDREIADLISDESDPIETKIKSSQALYLVNYVRDLVQLVVPKVKDPQASKIDHAVGQTREGVL
jgi:hypothetical protein